MRLVVTGATGFLGMRLVEMAVSAGYEVYGLGRCPFKGKKVEHAGAKFVQVDLSDQKDLERKFPDSDAVCHCAALSSTWGRYRDYYVANVLATRYLIEATNKRQMRFVHISSPSIYYQHRSQFGIRENSPLPCQFINHYAQTKYLAEQELLANRSKEMTTVILRPRAIFGPRDSAIVPRLIAANKIGLLPFFKRGALECDLTYVDNVVHAILLSLVSESVDFLSVYNITNDHTVDLKLFLAKLFEQLGIDFKPKHLPYLLGRVLAFGFERYFGTFRPLGEPPMTAYTVGLFSFSQTLNIDRAKSELGYKPIVNMDQGLERYTDWFQKQKCRKRI